MSWNMQIGGSDKFAIVHAVCAPSGTMVDVRFARIVNGDIDKAKEAADAVATEFDIDPGELSIVPAGTLTESGKAGRPPAK